jgi:hypothetical protein
MSTIFANVSGVAALVIIAGGILAIVARLTVAVLGRTFDPAAQTLVDTLISLLVGLAIGSGAGSTAVSLKLARALEMNAQLNIAAINQAIQEAATSGRAERSTPSLASTIDPKQYPTGG